LSPKAKFGIKIYFTPNRPASKLVSNCDWAFFWSLTLVVGLTVSKFGLKNWSQAESVLVGLNVGLCLTPINVLVSNFGARRGISPSYEHDERHNGALLFISYGPLWSLKSVSNIFLIPKFFSISNWTGSCSINVSTSSMIISTT